MNLQQAEYFLSVAECRSFSEAAKSLYMSQPALGRQIRALEIELELPLFVRGKRALELTAAGKVLHEELGRWINSYNKIVEKARLANASMNTTLDIGILEGHRLGSLFPAIYDYFCANFPDVQVNTHRASFGMLIDSLYRGDFDIAVTLDFDMAGRPDLDFRIIAEVENFLVVPSRHKLANQINLSLIDFQDDIFILNSPDDSRAGHDNLVESCRKAGFEPKHKQAATLDEYMLWLEIGYGVGVLSEHNILRLNNQLKFIRLPEIGRSSIVIAWLRDNVKPAAKSFIITAESLIKNNPPT